MTNSEIIEHSASTGLSDAVDGSLAAGLARAEIDMQVATARRYPRQISRVQSTILSLVTLDDDTAEECMYALPRGGKPIQGPSIRFAEIVKTSYGNCRAAARVVHVDRAEKVVIAEGVFHDLETNTASRAEVRRRISDKNGRIYSDDMIVVTGNAACSIAQRNAILGGVPKALWRKAYDEALHTVAGDTKTLASTREAAVRFLANYGVTPDQVFTALGVSGIEDINLNLIPTLRGMASALKNGEATVEEMFSTTVARTVKHEVVADPLRDEPATKSPLSVSPADAEAKLPESAADNAAGSCPSAEHIDSSTGEVTSTPLTWPASYIAAMDAVTDKTGLQAAHKAYLDTLDSAQDADRNALMRKIYGERQKLLNSKISDEEYQAFTAALTEGAIDVA